MSLAALKRFVIRWGAIAPLAIASPAMGAACAGFGDVDDASQFCANVGWLKNRQITLGCNQAGTAYCPNDAVSRLAMAAFMNRLGTALTPTQLSVDTAPGAINVDAGAVVCQTQPFVVASFPRRAYVDLSFSGQAAGDVGLAADIVMSSDGGATWSNLNAAANRGFVRASQWGAFADLGFVDLAVDQSVRWGVRTSRAGLAGTTNLSDSRCHLRVLVHSRNGNAAPF